MTAARNVRVIFDLFAARCQVCNGEREKKKKDMSKGNPRGRVRRREERRSEV